MYGLFSYGDFIPFTAARLSSDLKTHLNLKISQIELLGSATIGSLNEMLREMGTATRGVNPGVMEDDDGTVKYGERLVAILNDWVAYGEPYTTDATPHQYRMWLAHVRRFKFSLVFLRNPNVLMI
jgi:hypothetical protein